MRVMLFGATGQLGTSLAHAFADMDAVLVRRTDADFFTASPKELNTLVEKHDPSLLINAAAFAAVDDAESQREEAERVNATVPGWLGEIAKQRGIGLIHFSTDYVFDGARGAPYGEHAKAAPVNHYGATKLAGEQAILKSKADAVIFRLQLLYQATGNSFFCRMRKSLAENASLRVAADQIAAPTSVADVTQAVMQALPLVAKGKLTAGIYHMAAQGHTSRHGFACAIREAMLAKGMMVRAQVIEPITTAEFPSPAIRPQDVRLNTEKLAGHGIVLPHWHPSLKRVMDTVHETH